MKEALDVEALLPILQGRRSGMTEPVIKLLESGYVHVRWSSECWAQFPPWFTGDTLPDEYIFNPEWNRERVNAWWRSKEAQNDE